MNNKCINCETENQISSKYCSVCGHQLPLIENQAIDMESKKPLKTKKKWDFKTYLGFIVGLIGALFVTQSLFKPSTELDNQLVAMANEMNQTCPIVIDQNTTLQNISIFPNKTLQYNYYLHNISKAEIQLDTVKKYIFPSLLANIKNNPTMQTLRDYEVTFNYYYTDKNGEFVTEYKITPEMYE